MSSSPISNARLLAALCLLLAVGLHAQQTSGSISGTIKDRQGALVPGAKVTLIDQEKAAQREQTSSAEGSFTFTPLTPSTYTVAVEAAGFKKWETKDLKLYANDRLGLNDIMLDVGAITDSITVEATTVQLQTESAERSGVVTSQQMSELGVRDRSFLSLMATLPGVVGVTQYTANVNGLRDDQNSFKVDGITNVDSGVQQCCGAWINMDLISEMKVVTNNATADMGRMSGAQISVVTKSGSKELHGNAYFYKRGEWMNANSWTNNREGSPRGRDRSNQGGFTLGGPLFIPGKLNTSKDKLFFFVSEELWKNLSPNTGTRTVPTALERIGDFTQSQRSDGSAVTVLDPANNRTPYPNNKIPSNLFNADARKMMNLFPLPSAAEAADTDYTYNYRFYAPSSYTDRLLQSYRIDYNISDRWRVYGRVLRDYQETGSPLGMSNWAYPDGSTLGWTLVPRHGSTGVVNVTTIISPTFTNEFVGGFTRSLIPNYIDKNTYTRKALGLTYTPLYPEMVIGDYGPQVGFGGSGLSNAPSLGSNYPYIYYNNNYNFTDNLAKVMTRHTLKAGFMFELDRKDQDGSASYAGNFNFNRDSNNANDTDYQFANLLTGSFNTYSQLKKRIEGRYIYKNAEWYVQDTWKARPNLTIDAGLRFHYVGPGYDAHGQMANFDISRWDPAKAVKLYGYAGSNSGSGARAVDPVTGTLYPSLLRGAIAPNSGNIDNGFYVAGKNLIPSPGIVYGPRLGVAWQPGFLPKTVIRFGGGIFYDRIMGNVIYGGTSGPPTRRDPTLYYGNVSQVSSSLYTVLSPPGGSMGWGGSDKLPTTINYNFSIQREMPHSILLEAGYVGSISRQLIYQQPINEPGFGTAWLPWTQNPTVTPKYNGTTNLPTNYWRPYSGVGGINLYANGASANYNSLQLKAEKRMSRKLSFTAAYTWSKAMGVSGNIYTATNAFNARLYNYGRLSYDRTQLMTASYVYYLPKFGKEGNFLDHSILRLILNDWELSGLMTATTGSPTNFSFGFQNDSSNINQRWTGSPTYGPRPIVGDWTLSGDKTNEYAQFNTAAIQVPPGGPASPSVGLESGFNYWSNPAQFWSSIQTTMMKNFPFSADGRRYLQLRVETYNTFNHHDWTGRGMNATFNSPSNLTLTNLPSGLGGGGGYNGFGALTGAAQPRRLQIALKVYF